MQTSSKSIVPFINQVEPPHHWCISTPCWKGISLGKGLQCKNMSDPVYSVVYRHFEHEVPSKMDPKSAGYCLASSAMYNLLFLGIPLCLFCPALKKYIQLIYYHTCCPQGVFQNDLSLTLCYYLSLPSPFESYPLPAFFPSEFQGTGEAEFNYSFAGFIMLWHRVPRLGYKGSFIISCNDPSFLACCEFYLPTPSFIIYYFNLICELLNCPKL